MAKWPINADTVHNWVNYCCQYKMTLDCPITALLINLPVNVKATIQGACNRHHQDGTNATNEAQFCVSEHPDYLYFA
jgi:hypothetical protein